MFEFILHKTTKKSLIFCAFGFETRGWTSRWPISAQGTTVSCIYNQLQWRSTSAIKWVSAVLLENLASAIRLVEHILQCCSAASALTSLFIITAELLVFQYYGRTVRSILVLVFRNFNKHGATEFNYVSRLASNAG